MFCGLYRTNAIQFYLKEVGSLKCSFKGSGKHEVNDPGSEEKVLTVI